ncbi:MAG: efflux RND transporter periplasmic adaptor subunit [Bacillota bacterium]
MKHRLPFSFVMVLVLALVYGCAGDTGVKVVTEKTMTGTLSGPDSITGKTEAIDSVTIVPKIGGKVSEVPVDVGSKVKAGQVLLKMDAGEIEGTLNSARAAVHDAEAGIEKAKIDLNTARENYERAQNLYNSGALSKAVFDNQYSVPFELAKIQAEKTAPNRLAQAKAVLQTAEANYSNSIITSPLDGEVTARYINPGETCSTSRTVFVVTGLSGMAVRAFMDESNIHTLKAGQKVAVAVDSAEGLMEGEVLNISNAADPTTKGYQVKIRIINPSPSVKPGMFARLYADGGQMKQFIIPKTALTDNGGSYFVYIYNDGKVAKTPVQVEKISESFAVVKEGLTDGQELVVYSSSGLEDGMAVSPRKGN